METITSRKNSRVQALRALGRNKAYRREQGLFLCDGEKLLSEALANGAPSMEKMRDQYRRRRDFIVRRFNEMGMECTLPRGTFYAFPKVPDVGMDSMEFAKYHEAPANIAETIIKKAS